MATNNIFLGTGRRSIGDVVLYRRNGKQVARVRVRQVANPKTVPQSLQRVYFAPVSKFYSPLAGALERSWEGRNKSESFSRFLSVNLQRARSAGWYLPKGAAWFPLPYNVSSGSLPVVEYDFDSGGNSLDIRLNHALSANTLGALSRELISMGYQEGDQVTVIGAVTAGEVAEGVFTPTYFRFWLDSTSTTNLSDVGNGIISLFYETRNYVKVIEENDRLVGGAVIISRYVDGRWLRSTQSMVVHDDLMDLCTGAAARQSAIDSYSAASAVIESDIYLNGSTVNGSRAPRRVQQRIIAQIISAQEEVMYEVNPVSIEWGSDNPSTPAVVTVRNIANGTTMQAWVLIEIDNDDYEFIATGTTTMVKIEDEITELILDARDGESPIAQWLITNGASPDIWA